jgi:hypothetical protein
MEHEPGIFENPDPDAEMASLERARADRAAGRGYPHSIVKQWLKTWSQPDYKPFDEWLKSSG